MGTESPTKVMLGQTLVLMHMTFLNNVRKVGRLVLSKTSCLFLLSFLQVYNKCNWTFPLDFEAGFQCTTSAFGDKLCSCHLQDEHIHPEDGNGNAFRNTG
jgi:hypothetical protein